MGVNWLNFIRRKKVLPWLLPYRANCPIIVDSSFLFSPLYTLFTLFSSSSSSFRYFYFFSSLFGRQKHWKKGNFIVAGSSPANRARRHFFILFLRRLAWTHLARRKRKNEETKRRVNSGRFPLRNSTSKRPVDQAD